LRGGADVNCQISKVYRVLCRDRGQITAIQNVRPGHNVSEACS
jgi:hypothetical protein